MARNDRDRYILAADTYAQDLIPRARGQAARIIQDAEAYRDRVIAQAEGEASRFESVLTEYQRAPRVTRERLYIEALEDVYSRSAKVLLDAEGSGNLLYLPIDKLIGAGGRTGVSGEPGVSPDQPGVEAEDRRAGDDEAARDRRTRQ
jgi:membrane protease subunit HflK